MGITIAVVLTNLRKKKKSRNTTESQDDFEDTNIVKKKENTEEEYVSIVMRAIGSSFMEMFGTSTLTYGI